MAICLLRIAFMSSAARGTRSRPCQKIWPATMRPGGIGTSLRMDMAVTVLPQPDSPTTPTVSPRAMLRSTPSTAWTMPSSVAKCVFSPRISRSASPTPDLTLRALPSHHLAGVERIAQSITDEIYAQHREEDRGAWEQRPVRGDVQVVLGVIEDATPGGSIRRKTQAQERQGRLGDDGSRHVDRAGDDHRTQGIGQDMAHHLTRLRRAEGPGGFDELLLAQGEKLRPHQARHGHPAQSTDHGHDQDEDPAFGPK